MDRPTTCTLAGYRQQLTDTEQADALYKALQDLIDEVFSCLPDAAIAAHPTLCAAMNAGNEALGDCGTFVKDEG